MAAPEDEAPPDAVTLALAYARPSDRPVFAALFDLNARLGRVLARRGEPVLAQMRLAWWRDRLSAAPQDRPKGNPALDGLTAWAGRENALIALVDGWEQLIGEADLAASAITAFAEGHAAAFAAAARLVDAGAMVAEVERAGRRYALADLAVHSTRETERKACRVQAALLPAPARMGRRLRPFAVIEGLAARSLSGGHAPLLAGRGAALATLRIGMFGR